MNYNSLPFTPLNLINGSEFQGIQAYIKDESANPSGTIKDRRNAYVLKEALRMGVDKLVLLTAGSNGYSLGMLSDNRIEVIAVVDKSLPSKLKHHLSRVTYGVLETNLQYKILRPEEVVAFAREREDEVIWDVTNGYEEGYAPVVAELKELDPDWIVVPLGSGGVYVGIVEAVLRYKLKAKVIGIGVQNTNMSFADKLYTPWTPYIKVISKLSDHGNPIYRLSESEIKSTWRNFQNLANMEPSSAIVFAALKKHTFIENEKVVFINTGKLIG